MKKYIPILLILSLTLSACKTQESSLTGKWKLVSYGPPDAMIAAVPDADATLTFGADGTVTGSGGCNSLGGTYEVSDQTVTFSDLTSTLMACDDARMEQEGAVTQALSGTAEFEVDGRSLTIANNEVSLVFTAVPTE